MIDHTTAVIENLIFHKVGNETHESFANNSETEFMRGETEEETLLKIFLKPFINSSVTYEFKHEINLDMNPLYSLVKDIFGGDDFTNKSKDIHQHLISASKHPNIKNGDFFVIKYSNIKLGNTICEGLGVYKVENKENFIETDENSGDLNLNFKKGIGTKRLDKACLILFTEDPFTVFIIDNASSETDYWKNEFINVEYKKDHVNSTNQFLELTKEFITEQIPEEYDITKADQIDLLNRSVEYFKSNETFDKQEFESTVFQENEIIDSFRSFDETYQENSNLELADSFEISAQAVKKQARIFKSVLKLDKNFHIYIHGDKELIQQGTESDGRKFYKIYYTEEK